MGENIYEDKLPILFGDDGELNEYQRKQNKKTKKLLDATESNNVTEFLVKLVYGEDFNLPVRRLDTEVEAHGQRVGKKNESRARYACRESHLLEEFGICRLTLIEPVRVSVLEEAIDNFILF